MCSREGRNRDTYDPSWAVLEPLITANQTLRDNLEPTFRRLEDLSDVLQGTTRFSTTAEATCIEALTIIEPALASIRRYHTFYAPLFDAPDPVPMLRQAGVIFEGDEGDDGQVVAENERKTMHMIWIMKRLVQAEEEKLKYFEYGFRRHLDKIRERERLENERDELRLAVAEANSRLEGLRIEVGLLVAEIRVRMELEADEEDDDEVD